MDKQIPQAFDNLQFELLPEADNGSHAVDHALVRVFTKYANRNGSYITDEVADQLIASATSGNVPVIGFQDPQTKSQASHTGPTLANAYGYVDEFLGWEDHTDSDGVSRTYATFSVRLFNDYFEEANHIVGQNQSMELDIDSIQGDQAQIGDNEYFVYTTAKMLGFCVIGEHEPCFQGAAFFSKENCNNIFATLQSLKEKEAYRMPKQEDNAVVEATENQEDSTTITANFADQKIEVESAVINPDASSTTDFTADLQKQITEDNEKLSAFAAQVADLTSQVATLQSSLTDSATKIAELTATITEYEKKEAAYWTERKKALLDKYEKMLDADFLDTCRTESANLSYNELESKLAVAYANKQFALADSTEKVPIPEVHESQFALLMKKYRKN